MDGYPEMFPVSKLFCVILCYFIFDFRFSGTVETKHKKCWGWLLIVRFWVGEVVFVGVKGIFWGCGEDKWSVVPIMSTFPKPQMELYLRRGGRLFEYPKASEKSASPAGDKCGGSLLFCVRGGKKTLERLCWCLLIG